MAASNVTMSAGWQYGKSLKDCVHHMFTSQIATDVCFEVQLRGGSTAGSVKAHKFVLMCRSAVFEKLLTDQPDQDAGDQSSASIKINDMELDVFNELLTYFYTDNATVTAANALPLIYAAKKYQLSGLLELCRTFLQERLATENVCTIMNKSLEFDETDLKERCIKLICSKVDEVIKIEGFLALTANALEILIGDDDFNPGKSEYDVHTICITWATSQLQQYLPITQPTDLQIREKLGSILYRIRYPLFTSAEFGGIFCKNSQLVSDQEQLSIYKFIATKEKDKNFLFDWKQRYRPCSVDRFSVINKSNWNSTGHIDAIQFMTDKNILLTGFGLYPGTVVTYITVQLAGALISTTNVDLTQHGGAEKIKLNLEQPIEIKAGNTYVVQMPGLQMACYGQGGTASCSDQGVTLSFTQSPLSTYTTPAQGQIPQLFFKCNEV